MNLFIDGKIADCDQNTDIKISLALDDIADPEKRKTGYSNVFNIPISDNNRKLLGNPEEIYDISKFNDQLHSAKIEANGSIIMSGSVYLIECVINNSQNGYYSIALIGHGTEWVNVAKKTNIRELNIDFHETINAALLAQSWEWDKPVRFFPVKRSSLSVEKTNLFPPVKILAFEDYHPFIHIKTLIYKIFNNAGYKIQSEFFESDLFNSLYMSGNYPTKNIDNDKNQMDFLAGRFDDITASANDEGKVYAKPLQNTNSLKNIVETADPKEVYNGNVLDNVFSINNCFSKINNRIVFVPTHETLIGFEFNIAYSADYYIKNRDELDTFNTIYLWAGQERNYKVINRYQDRKNEFRAGKTFLLIVFEHNDGDSYQFGYDEITDASTDDSVEHILTQFSTRTQSITVESGIIKNPKLWIKKQGQENFSACDKDWALYDGYVLERGQIDIELTVRSSPERILPSNPKYFDQIYFGGAQPGMNLTLKKETTLKPVFADYPCEQSSVKFEDIAVVNANGMELINALKHIFNLYFYTDNVNKKVFIEPRDMFYDSNIIIDWRNRIDLNKPISIKDPANDMPNIIAFEYMSGDDAVATWNQKYDDNFGTCSWKIENSLYKNEKTSYVNPLFTPSINVSGEFPDAPDASLIQAGNQYQNPDKYLELNFPAKIVRFLGMKQLDGAQKWGWPSYQAEYPLIAFHYPSNQNDEFSLCFEDRDNITGLHKYYDSNIKMYLESKIVEAYIDILPHEIENFINPNSKKNDFRALFRLNINGENAIYRIIQIINYNTNDCSTKCVFIKIV